jgi:hypothetical protein
VGPNLSLAESVAREGPIFGVGRGRGRIMSYPGPGPIYRRCIVCGRPFRVWRCELLRNRAKFCTRECYSASRRLFSNALADGRLELILSDELERIKAERGEASWRSLSKRARRVRMGSLAAFEVLVTLFDSSTERWAGSGSFNGRPPSLLFLLL